MATKKSSGNDNDKKTPLSDKSGASTRKPGTAASTTPKTSATKASKTPASAAKSASTTAPKKETTRRPSPRKQVSDTVDQVKEVLESVAPKPMAPMIEALSSVTKMVASTIAEALPNTASSEETSKPDTPQQPLDTLRDTVGSVASTAAQAIPVSPQQIVETIRDTAGSVVSSVSEAMPSGLQNAASNARERVADALQKASDAAGEVMPDGAQQALSNAADAVKDEDASVTETVSRVADAVTSTMTPETFSLLSDPDVYLFNEGTHLNLYDRLGAHIIDIAGVRGTYFAVWAPNAASVAVIGDFNGWDASANPLRARSGSGIWEGFFAGVDKGTHYKYRIVSRHNGYTVDKTDPFGFHSEVAPQTASVVWDLDYEWNDESWMQRRREIDAFKQPWSIYEVHLGSWRRVPEENDRFMTYREIAPELARYVKEMGFTHVEFLPLTEHPFYGSWGYQSVGLFAPTSRYGTPQDLMYLIDYLHREGIGVIFDWVPSHFPTDEHGLAFFDGTHLFEHADPRQGFHPDWNSYIFNYGRNEVRSVLLSSASYWADKYHIDGIRVDAVASMLYLDYSRKQGEWIPNKFGGRENIEAVEFLRKLNESMYGNYPGIQIIAEESTAWPMVSRPLYVGGLGFGMKWDMGWMHDTLRYMQNDPIHRRFHHNVMTFRMMYAYTENFVLPLSHDEVVHGKGSLINKMPGDEWQKFANLRLLYAYMWMQPGKKLLFMGGEFGQWREWSHDRSLDWHLLEQPFHGGLRQWLGDLNRYYRDLPEMHELDFHPDGFQWIDANDSDQSVLSMIRRDSNGNSIAAVMNFTPVVRHNYQIGVPHAGFWREVLNSDAPNYGGSGQGNLGGVEASPVGRHGRAFSINVTLPPLGAVFFKLDPADTAPEDVDASI